MSDYLILTDSSADLPQWKLEEMGIETVALTVDLDGASYINYPDWREIDPHSFYEELRAGKPASTSAANVDTFKTAMVPHLEAGRDILYIGFSSGLSGTYNAGRIAAEELSQQYPDRKILAIDSLAASLGQGLLVVLVAEKKRAGAEIGEAAAYCEEMKLKICHWFTVDDLFYLHRGGRVSKATAVIGTTLGIKPVMHTDDEGHLTKVDVARGRKASIKRIADKLRATNTSLSHVYISHGDCLEDAELLKEMLAKDPGVKDILIDYVGPVIGAHSGPGTLALFFVGTQR